MRCLPSAPQLSRRRLLAATTGAVGMAAASVLAACGGATTATASRTAGAVSTSSGRTASAVSTSSSPAVTSSAGSSTSAAAVPAKAGQAPGTPVVTLQGTTWLTSGQLKTFQALFDDFEQATPDIKVNLVSTPKDYEQKLLTLAASGELPDFMHTSLTWAPKFEQDHLFLDVASYFKTAKFDDSLYFGFTDLYRRDGHIWGGLENHTQVYPLFYNATMFKDVGIATPYDQWKAGKWDWNAFLETARKLTNGQDRWGFLASYAWETGWTPWLYANGATDWVTVDDRFQATFHLTSAPVTDATQFDLGLITKEQVSPKPGAIQTEHGNDPFSIGKVAMVINGTWNLSTYPQLVGQNFEIGIAPVPANSPNHVKSMYPVGADVLVSASTKHPEDAVKLGLFFLGPVVQNAYAANHLSQPLLRSAFDTPAFKNWSVQHLDVETYYLANHIAEPVFNQADQIMGRISSELKKAFLGTESLSAALSEAQRTVTGIEASSQ